MRNNISGPVFWTVQPVTSWKSAAVGNCTCQVGGKRFGLYANRNGMISAGNQPLFQFKFWPWEEKTFAWDHCILWLSGFYGSVTFLSELCSWWDFWNSRTKRTSFFPSLCLISGNASQCPIRDRLECSLLQKGKGLLVFWLKSDKTLMAPKRPSPSPAHH